MSATEAGKDRCVWTKSDWTGLSAEAAEARVVTLAAPSVACSDVR